jgi:glycosyltransferase involved in cell wall biosynthesis
MLEKELEDLLQALDQALLQHQQLLEALSKAEVPELEPNWYQVLRLIISNKQYANYFHELPKNIGIVNREDFIVEFCKGRRVLHVGCVDEGLVEAKLKSGKLLHQKLQAVCQHLVGIDISSSGVKLLQQAGFQDVFLLDVVEVEKLPYKDFDVVLLGEVLEHLPNPSEALKGLAIFPKADFLITVPNRFSWEGMYFAKRDIEFVNPDHCYYFSYHTLRTLLQKCNYQVLDMYYYTHRLSNTSFVAKLKERPQFCEGLICIARVKSATKDAEDSKLAIRSHQEIAESVGQEIHAEEGMLLKIQKDLSTLKAELSQLLQQILKENKVLKEQLRVKDQQLEQVKSLLSSKERELQQSVEENSVLSEQLHVKEQQLEQMKNLLQTQEHKLQQLVTQLQTRDKELAQAHEEVTKLKKGLIEIYNSLGWKLLDRFWQVTNRLLPPGTRRRLWFNQALFAIKVVTNEGWGSLWRHIREKMSSKFPRDKTSVNDKTNPATKKTRLMVFVPLMQAGGAERRTSILLEQFDRRLIEPELTIFFDSEIFYPVPEDVRMHILEKLPKPATQISTYIRLPDHLKEQQRGAVFLETAALRLANLAQERQCDVILSTQLWTSIIAVLARKYLPPSIRVIATVDNHPSTFLPGEQYGELYAYLIREYFNQADRVVAVGHGVAQDLIKNFGVKAEKIEVIYTPTLLKGIQKLARSKIDHPWFREKVPIIIFVGGLRKVKGVEHLLRAFAKVRRSTPARCVLVGDGEERARLETLAQELGIGEDVYFAGRQSNPFKYMKRATSFVLPSLSEGLPNVLIEAMACGCPVIATDVASGGSREVLGGGEYGILVPPGDEEGLAQAILRVLQDPALRKRLSRLASQYAQKFDALQSVQKYTHLIKRLHEEAQSVKAIKAMVVVPVMEAGGAERGTALLLQHLDRQIVRPELAIAFDREIFYPIPSDVQVHILERQPEPQQAMSEPTLPPDLLEYRNSVLWLEKMALKLATLVKEQKSDVIFSTQLWSSIIATMARKYLPPHVRVIAMVVSHPSTRLPGEKYATLYTYLMRGYFNEADRIVAVSEGIAKDLVDNYGVKPEKIDVIHYPVDWAKVQELAQEPVEHEWFSQEIPIVLFVGRLEAVKGVEHLLRAFAKVRRQMAARCVLVGDGKEREKLQELAHQLGIEQDVYFAGRQSNPFKYMKRATSFVLPSLSEGLPNVLIEAMACGCPVIATDVASGGSREVLGGGEYGILVPPGDEEGLAQAILRVLQDPALRKRLSRLASQYAQKFDVHEIVPQYARLLKPVKMMVLVPTMRMGGAERNTALLLEHIDRGLVNPELALVFNREIFYSIPKDVPIHVLENIADPPQLPISDDPLKAWLEKMALKLAGLVQKRHVDILFSTQLWTSIIAALARKHLPSAIRVIATVDCHPSTFLPSHKHGELYTYLMRGYFNEADRIVAVSEGIAKDLVDNYGVKPEKIDVIHYPVDWAKVQELAQEPVEHEWFSQEIPIVLFVGRLEAVKGVEHLLRAFAKVRRQMAARCVLVGDGQEREKLQELAHQLGIEQDVYFAGRQSNPFKYMKRATSFVLPSLSEGLPNVLIEAMACGCPVIATDVASGGSREVLGGGEYGILVPPGDEEGLAQAILRVLQDPALRKRLSRLASQYAQKFDVHEIFRKYNRLIVNGRAN